MIPTITILVLATIAVAAFALAPRLGERRIVYPTTPDQPVPFGYQMTWLAIRTRDSHAVVEALGLIGAKPCNWNSGIGTVYDAKLGQHNVFVSPHVNGWTFVVGLPLPQPLGRSFADKATPLLVELGQRFVEVQSFVAFPPVDLFAWARLVDGRLLRAFAIGDDGVIWNKGKPTREERTLGLARFELRGVRDRRGDAGGAMILHPTEDHVMRLAGKWSLDPTSLGPSSAPAAMGLIAQAPALWRVERLRRTA